MAVIARVTSASDIPKTNKEQSSEEQSPKPSSLQKASSECASSDVIPQSDQITEDPNQKKFTDREKDAAKTLFAENIRNGVKLRVAEARNKMSTVSSLRMKALKISEAKQVVNFINYIIDKQPVVSPESLPVVSKQARVMEYTNFQDDDSSTIYSGRHLHWTEEDTALISESFEEYVTCPSQDTHLHGKRCPLRDNASRNFQSLLRKSEKHLQGKAAMRQPVIFRVE